VLHDHAALVAGVERDLTEWLLERPAHDEPACLLVVGAAAHLVDGRLGTEQGHATAGEDSLFHGGPGRLDGVLDAVLLLLQLDLGGGADLDDGDAAGELGEPLLELLAVPVGVGVLDLAPDLLDPPLTSVFVPSPSTMVVLSLVTTTLRALPSRSTVTPSSLRPTSSEITVATGEDGDVLEHGLAPLTEAGGLDGHRLRRCRGSC
jgi:putative effector of murein hydrolase LrgA (UPF0299 family)